MSYRTCAGKRQTLRATIVIIFSHMTRDVSVFVATQFLDFFWKLPQIKTYKLCNVVWQHTEGMAGCITWVLLEIYLTVQL